ncbi:DUF4339 domain-containing protein [Ferruginibacter sp.]
MKKYYLHNGTQQEGPFDFEELKLKNLTGNTPVWFEGLSEWTTIENVEELKSIIVVTPPPFAAKTAAPPPIQEPIVQEEYPGNNQQKNNATLRKLLMLAGLIVIVLIGIFVYNQILHKDAEHTQDVIKNLDEEAKKEEEQKKAAVKSNISTYITAENNEYFSPTLGGIKNLKVTVSNKTDYLIDKVKVNIKYIKLSGEVWDTKLIEFNLLEPNTKLTKQIEDTERGTKVQLEIVEIKSSVLGL